MEVNNNDNERKRCVNASLNPMPMHKFITLMNYDAASFYFLFDMLHFTVHIFQNETPIFRDASSKKCKLLL